MISFLKNKVLIERKASTRSYAAALRARCYLTTLLLLSLCVRLLSVKVQLPQSAESPSHTDLDRQ